MPIKKWIFQYSIAFPILSALFSSVQYIKGQTVSSSFKPAILKNGIKVMVPGHIEVGTKIVVRPYDGTYIEKAKI